MVMMVGASAFANATRRDSMPDGGLRGRGVSPTGGASKDLDLALEEVSVLHKFPLGRSVGKAIPGMRRPGTSYEVVGGAGRNQSSRRERSPTSLRPNTVANFLAPSRTGMSVSNSAPSLQQNLSSQLGGLGPGFHINKELNSLKQLYSQGGQDLGLPPPTLPLKTAEGNGLNG